MTYNGRMKQVGLRELNQHASRVIDRVKRGEVVEVTDRGRPVARVVPVIGGGAVLEALVRQGRAAVPSVTGPLPLPSRSGTARRSAADEVARLRDEETH